MSPRRSLTTNVSPSRMLTVSERINGALSDRIGIGVITSRRSLGWLYRGTREFFAHLHEAAGALDDATGLDFVLLCPLTAHYIEQQPDDEQRVAADHRVR